MKRSITGFLAPASLFAAAAIGFSGCSQSGSGAPAPSTPVVTSAKQEVVAKNKPEVSKDNGATPNPSATPSQSVSLHPGANSKVQAPAGVTLTGTEIQVEVTLKKQVLFNQEFIYNVDLQYSSQYDAGMDLYNQSMTVASVPARFRIQGKQLQLVADMKHKYPSDVNHPEQLLSRYEILSQTADEITVKGGNASNFIASQFAATATARDHWIRSFDFAAQGNYILQESSIILNDGSIVEVMESVFPSSNLAVDEKSFEKIKMNPDNPIGGDDGAAARYRFLTGETIFAGEDKHAFAQHFDISPKADGTPGTIDWYVTRNIPEEHVPAVREAVEGWNRYFRKMDGIERDVMRFMGRLPEGIRLGDPRFNVINWDSRLVAGAAYESQAIDPRTGRQSHSLIYMPAAWLTIGSSYWSIGLVTDEENSWADLQSLKINRPAFSKLQCSRDLRRVSQIASSGRLPEDQIAEFGTRLLKQTLFHELGHALGLAHNFKGSLTYDRSIENAPFSSSIMDYNDYEVERGAFKSVDSAEGPLLEYDRQALSALYNRMKDVKDSDSVMPACNDAEADNEAGGVDPLCIRYDIESDPTKSVTTALDRITATKLDRDVTLAQAVLRVPAIFLSDDKIAAAKDSSALLDLATQLAQSLRGSVGLYYITGETSVSRTVRTNIKSLLMFGDELPTGYSEREMRERVLNGVQQALAMKELPAQVETALQESRAKGLERLAQTPFMKSLDPASRAVILDKLDGAISKIVGSFKTDSAQGLPRLRTSVLGSLLRHTAVPFYLGEEGGTRFDYEASLVAILKDVVLAKSGRTAGERVTAAKALATYKGRYLGNQAIAEVKPILLEERATSTSNVSREAIESMLKALGINE